MKYAVIALVALVFVVGAVSAGPKDTSKRATEVMFPIDQFKDYRDYFEGFEGTIPPTGWILVQTNLYETWGIGTYAPYEGFQYATCLYDASYSGPQDEWLKFDYEIQAGDDILGFFAQASTYWAIDPYQNYNLLVTIDGVTVWDYYNDNNGAVSWQWQEYTVGLGAYSVGQVITVGLGYQGFDGAQGSFDALYIGEGFVPPEPCCPFDHTCYVVDFNEGPDGWYPLPCGVGPIPWQWGSPVGIPTVACDAVPVTHVLATNLTTAYPVQTGEGAVIGPFDITAQCYCMELCHFYDIETGYDGGNVKVSTDGGVTWQLVYPFRGYDDILDSATFIAECVWGEEVFSAHQTAFLRDCFDLTQYVGQSIMVGFFFGADSSVTYPGWYIKWVKFGSDETTPVEDTSWGSIKALYR
jgi:hypothetical protein